MKLIWLLYLVALLSICGATAKQISPQADDTSLVAELTALVTATGPIVASLVAALAGYLAWRSAETAKADAREAKEEAQQAVVVGTETHAKVQAISVQIDGQFHKFAELIAKDARAEGDLAGRAALTAEQNAADVARREPSELPPTP